MATLMMSLLLSSSIYVIYYLFALLQLLVLFTVGRASLCVSVAYMKADFCSQIILP